MQLCCEQNSGIFIRYRDKQRTLNVKKIKKKGQSGQIGHFLRV